MKIRNGFVSNSSSSSFVIEASDRIGSAFLRNFTYAKESPSKDNLQKEIQNSLTSNLMGLDHATEKISTILDYNFLIKILSQGLHSLKQDKYKPLVVELSEILKLYSTFLNKLKQTPLETMVQLSPTSYRNHYLAISEAVENTFGENDFVESSLTYTVSNLDYHDWDGEIALLKTMAIYEHIKIIAEENT